LHPNEKIEEGLNATEQNDRDPMAKINSLSSTLFGHFNSMLAYPFSRGIQSSGVGNRTTNKFLSSVNKIAITEFTLC